MAKKPLSFKSPHRTDWDIDVAVCLERMSKTAIHQDWPNEYTFGEMAMALDLAAKQLKK